MSYNDEVETAQMNARLELFKALEKSTQTVSDLHIGSQAEALKNLAEAYAWLSSTNQPH